MSKPVRQFDPREGFKLERDHMDNCMVKFDPVSFAMPADGRQEFEWRLDKIGRRNGSTMWFRYRCNDPDCPATLLVRWDTLTNFINRIF